MGYPTAIEMLSSAKTSVPFLPSEIPLGHRPVATTCAPRKKGDGGHLPMKKGAQLLGTNVP